MTAGGGPLTLTLPQAARQLGVSETLARQLARQGKLPGAFQLGKRWLVHRALFERGIEQLASIGELEPDDALAERDNGTRTRSGERRRDR
jgi:excisionase family DNA binding protein